MHTSDQAPTRRRRHFGLSRYYDAIAVQVRRCRKQWTALACDETAGKYLIHKQEHLRTEMRKRGLAINTRTSPSETFIRKQRATHVMPNIDCPKCFGSGVSKVKQSILSRDPDMQRSALTDSPCTCLRRPDCR